METGSLSTQLKPLLAALALAWAILPAQAQPSEKTLAETTVLGTAEDALKQAPGVSIITKEDIEKRPPANDISELVRTMPGVNLTGNSSSGQRGNNRQIDLRGMGPENTLILIDGKPATSRNSVRMGWRGERDSRGDSNWVPAEQIESIEVIRGPAAARYGNGAAGGVVNIVTKKPTKETHGQVTVYANAPVHAEEGATRRTNFSLSGPLAENFSYRLSGNANETGADSTYINADHRVPGFSGYPAGREGVRNRDWAAQLSWNLLPGHTVDLDVNYGRQGNIYTGDTQNVNTNTNVEALRGTETNIVTKRTYALTHKGKFDFGTARSYVQYSETENARILEGLVGGTEGAFTTTASPPYTTSLLQDLTVHSETNVPIRGKLNQMLTTGVEWTGQKLQDPSSTALAILPAWGTIPGVSSSVRGPDSSANIFSVFAEDNIELSQDTVLTPGLRFDNHTQSGSNWSPALNLTHLLSSKLSVKAGIARSYKAPNLFQSNANYVLFSQGGGCPTAGNGTTGCFLVGNENLEAETSTNKELGIEFKDERLVAGITWFHNDYRNKIQAGTVPVAIVPTSTATTRSLYQWTNIPEAVVQGLEGNLRVPVTRALDWINNFTYMIESRNKTTGDYLAVIPEYTVNTSLDWRATPKLGVLATATLYGEQKPMKYDFQGNPVTGTSANSVAPYAVFGLGGNYEVSKGLKVAAGVNNLFDKRQFRAGNSVSVVSGAVTTTSLGAGAATYNEPGRTFYVSATQSF